MKIGFAVADITPELGIYLTGYGMPERLAESVHSPLEAAVMVLQEEKTTALLISLDWCFIDDKLSEKVCKGISEKTNIPPDHILLSCTHTHSAPHTGNVRSFGRLHVDPEEKGIEYVLNCIPVLAECTAEALQNLQECEAGFGHTHTKTGVSRRGTDEAGRVTGFIEDPYQIYDSNMSVIHFRNAETKKDLGIFIHASCHNTCMGANRAISGDWCGVMKRRVKNVYGNIPVLFINGAVGDVGPRTNKYSAQYKGFSAGGGDGVVSVDEIGYRAASDALRALENIRDFRKDLPLVVHTGILTAPLEQSIPLEEARSIMENYEKDPARKRDYLFAKSYYETMQKEVQTEQKIPHTILAFGPVAIVPFPFEMFSIFSLRLRKYSPYAFTLLTSVTNGYFSYMPDKGAFAAGGYEAGTSRSYRPFVITPDAGDTLILQSLAFLREMFQ